MTSTLQAFMAEYVYHPDYTDEPTEQGEAIVSIVQTAVDELLRVHATTGIDLTCWEPVLPLITLVYPSILLEGTGETTEHQQHSDGETGRYWIYGDPLTFCNADAYVMSDSPWAASTRDRLGIVR